MEIIALFALSSVSSCRAWNLWSDFVCGNLSARMRLGFQLALGDATGQYPEDGLAPGIEPGDYWRHGWISWCTGSLTLDVGPPLWC